MCYIIQRYLYMLYLNISSSIPWIKSSYLTAKLCRNSLVKAPIKINAEKCVLNSNIYIAP